MMKATLTAIAISAFLFAGAVNAQTSCKVLNPSIADSYTGGCKNGLADGKGEALGTDQYKGQFKKGLPDGKGTYIWQTGEKYEGDWKKGLRDGDGSFTFKSEGKDTVLTGIWSEDKYIGEKPESPYTILYRNSISRATIMKSGDIPNYVVYKFSRAGGSMDDINELILTGSSGDETISQNFTGFEQVTFPFEGRIKFMAPNALRTAIISYELRYKINEPGAWIVTIFY